MAQKVKAGAHLCFVNLPHSTELVLEFREAVLRHGVIVPLIVGVPVITSRGAAEQMVGFQGLKLPHGLPRADSGQPQPEARGDQIERRTRANDAWRRGRARVEFVWASSGGRGAKHGPRLRRGRQSAEVIGSRIVDTF